MRAFVTGGSGFVGRNLILALKARGDDVRALARSSTAADAVRALGAEPVSGDLDDVAALRVGMAGCEAVFHAAATVTDWGDAAEFERVNVGGTRNVIEAARGAAVRRLVYVSTEAVLIGGPPMRDADETWPYPRNPAGIYPKTKGAAERLVLAASTRTLSAVAVRPSLVWGRGDTSVLAQVAKAIHAKRFMWVQGRYWKSTTHVANLVEGLILAAERGQPNEVYFLTDGPPVEFRPFFDAMLRAAGLDPGTRTIPKPVVLAVAFVVETVWKALRLKGQPPIRRSALHILADDIRISDAKARRELGYRGRMTREQGLKEMTS